MGVVYEPQGNKVMLKKLDFDQRSDIKIVLPDGVRTKDFEVILAEIMAIGPGLWQNGVLCPCQYKVGDVVYLQDGPDLELNGFKFKMCFEHEIICAKRSHE
jgi:co-chaperonin GroES (HSP10)